ncbi:MAG: response regulator, partial [Myxococcota bacterium]
IDCHLVDSGDAALTALQRACTQRSPYDLLIIDHEMPGFSGLQTVAAADERGFLETTKSLVLSSVGAFEPARILTGVDSYLMKPVRRDGLRRCLERILGQVVTVDLRPPSPELHIPTDLRVLVVEDNEVNSEVLIGMLQTFGIEPRTSENGRKAVESFRRDAFDLVFMDCQMPVMNGYEATRVMRRIEEDHRRPHTPIVALTANSFPEDVELCKAVGMDDFVRKPISMETLAAALERNLRSNRASMAVPESPVFSEPVNTADLQMRTTDLLVATVEDTPDDSDLVRIDRAVLDSLFAMRRPDKPDIAARVIRRFIETMPIMIQKLDRHRADDDLIALARIAHVIKGASSTLGACRLADVARLLEQSARKSDLKAADELVPQVCDEIRWACEQFVVIERELAS